ncbi:MAG: NAD(P)-dependent oxidoreductase [Candidatus Thiodiazotropha lotti]|nr:NAD(P)-dependent oxidoreductase [Candidatus Thiodiazotropha lotti]
MEKYGFNTTGIDIADGSGDITKLADIRNAMAGCHGVVHLAAVSRVAWAQQNPKSCWKTNAVASKELLKLAVHSNLKPWVIVASSREVYGEPSQLPTVEDAPLQPINIYGRAKVSMEVSALEAREHGLNTAIVRLSNVYGCPYDHVDRVIPAFCRNAARNLSLRVDGNKNLFDFTHISDVVAGLSKLVRLLERGESKIPPIQFVTGQGTTLSDAAEMATNIAESSSAIIQAPSRNYDVHRFIGNPARAQQILGWHPTVYLVEGMASLVSEYKRIFLIDPGNNLSSEMR